MADGDWKKGWILEAGTIYRIGLDDEGRTALSDEMFSEFSDERIAEADIEVEFVFPIPGGVLFKDAAGASYFVPDES